LKSFQINDEFRFVVEENGSDLFRLVGIGHEDLEHMESSKGVKKKTEQQKNNKKITMS
jgi:hypothetical protein